jgi:AcrR family transcriptional regulator
VIKSSIFKSGSELSIPSLRKDANKNMVKVLHAAKKVFAEKGFDTTIEEVAKKASVGVGTIYRRFSNKHQLATAVVMDIFIEIYEKQVEISKGAYSANRKIELIFEHFSDIGREYGKIHEMALKMMNSGDLNNEMQAWFFKDFKGIIKKVILQGQEEGIFREGNPEIYEILLFNMANPQVAYQLNQLIPSSEVPKYLTEMILKGLSK